MGTEITACYRCYCRIQSKLPRYLSKEAKHMTVPHDERHRVNESNTTNFFSSASKALNNTSINYQTHYIFVQLFVEILIYS